MNTEIYQLVKHLDRTGLENLSYEEKRVELWQRAIKEWNKTHSPVTTSLENISQAFKFRWPQIYGGEPNNNSLYLSFSYIDYLFSMNVDNQVCGGICKRNGEVPKVYIYMTAEQITDLAALLRIVPEPLEDWEKDEEAILECEEWINNLDDRNQDPIQQASLHFQMLATSQYMLGMFEESIISITRAIQSYQYFKLEWNLHANSETANIFAVSDATSLAEMYTQLADNFVYTFHWPEAEWCYKFAYHQNLNIFEKEDWKDYEYMYQPKETRLSEGQDRRCIYLNWAWSYAMFNVKYNRTKKAIDILCKAKKVAKSMNKAENGKWSAKLESITNKIEELKSSLNSHPRSTTGCENSGLHVSRPE